MLGDLHAGTLPAGSDRNRGARHGAPGHEGREPADRRTPAPSAHVTGADRNAVVGGKTFGPAGWVAGCDHTTVV